MAAETMATELVKVVFNKLADEALKRIVRSQGIHEELKELKSTFSRIQDLLNDASQKEVTDKSVKQWLNGFQHLAYDIDDLLDDLATDAMHRELTPESGASTSKVRKLIPTCCTSFSLSHRLAPKLDSINKELARLEKNNPGLIKKDEKPRNTSRRNETSLLERDIVGREDEKEKLLKKLLGDEPSKDNFSIVPIVGMGGIGKTTLARLLYNSTEVKGHFELTSWVCVSDDFDIFKISDTILQSVIGENEEKNKEVKDLNKLQMDLVEKFKGKRFLLVVDDVWNENYGEWENLVRPFHSGAHGSKIIMTTRNDKLLKKLGFNHLDRLECLSAEDALSLFALHALGVDNFNSHTTLKPTSEGIVKKCGHLPLAIKAIGRLLRTKTYGEGWDDVLNSDIWDLEIGDEIVPALMLSYQDLSADLKQLFAYCSLFPKDFVFNKEELVLLWMAEGFLNPSNASKSPERLGYEYFDILLSRSFFQQSPNEESLFMMHDLMVDLATFVAGEFFLRFENLMQMGTSGLHKCCYISFTREQYVGYHKLEELKRVRSLRTLLAVYVGVDVDQRWRKFYLSNKILVDLLPQLTLLRVLSLSSFEIKEVPEFIGSLKHLRYLNLSRTKIEELPENVGNLYNLQTLIVFGCEKLKKLPKSFLKLKKLRHFDIRETPLLRKLPLGISKLKSLYTLTKIIIGADNGFAITELKGFKNLHGEISIEGLERVQSVTHARDVNVSLKEIAKLELKWADVFDGLQRGLLEKEVLSVLNPNSDRLNQLAISSYGGTKFSSWVGDPSFHELVNVTIRGCKKCTFLPPFGQLHSLKKLLIQGMDEVKVIGLEFSGTDGVAFPKLESLQFENMPGWEAWSTGSKGAFPSLQELRIKNCGNLVDISLEALSSLRILEISTCGDGVLRSLVKAASSITKLEITSISRLTDEAWRGVMKYLGVVEDVTIYKCNEIRYLWESELEASKVLQSLKKLKVSECLALVSLGEKEEDENIGSNHLSSLRMLEIYRCKNIEFCYCPNSNSIESLKIKYCDSITRVFFPTVTATGGQMLKSLVIQHCEKVMETINNARMPMLAYLFVERWEYLKSLVQLSNCSHLTQLYIYNCPGIESFHDLHLSNLTLLSVYACENVKSLPELSNLTLLKSLTIHKCPSMDCSFLRGLWPPNLCSLKIGKLKKPISEWGLQNYPSSLVDLDISFENGVSNFSQLSHVFPSSLTQLHIRWCHNVESLSMGLEHLDSLQHLVIEDCPKMIDLPEMLLPSLLRLEIYDCPNLVERYNGRGSHYWPLISHIPCIKIGSSMKSYVETMSYSDVFFCIYQPGYGVDSTYRRGRDRKSKSEGIIHESTLDSIFKFAFGVDLDSMCDSSDEGRLRFSNAFDDASALMCLFID